MEPHGQSPWLHYLVLRLGSLAQDDPEQGLTARGRGPRRRVGDANLLPGASGISPIPMAERLLPGKTDLPVPPWLRTSRRQARQTGIGLRHFCVPRSGPRNHTLSLNCSPLPPQIGYAGAQHPRRPVLSGGQINGVCFYGRGKIDSAPRSCRGLREKTPLDAFRIIGGVFVTLVYYSAGSKTAHKIKRPVFSKVAIHFSVRASSSGSSSASDKPDGGKK